MLSSSWRGVSKAHRALALAVLGCVSLSSHAAEVVVQNDNAVDGQAVGVCPCFIPGEEAAAWLTAPCNGSIVAVQIFWGTALGGNHLPTLEDSIRIYSSGAFPAPGPVMTNAGGFPAILEGPVMETGGLGALNEFRFLDEAQTIPLSVPVTTGQTFVVSLKFANENNGELFEPSVAWDCNSTGSPCQGNCQFGRNAVFAIPGGWINVCTAPGGGANGDWIIRAVIDCGALPASGACCVNGNCSIQTDTDCAAAGGTFLGAGTTCSGTSCNGACCTTTNSCVFTTQANCNAAGGTFHGAGTNCGTVVCNPMGACCLEDGTCLAGPMSPEQCAAQGGAFLGNGSTCPSAQCVAPVGACCLGETCLTDLTQADCVTGFGGQWAGPNTVCGKFTCPVCYADIDDNGSVDVDDLVAVILAWGPCNNCPPDIDPAPLGNNQVNVDDLIAVILSWGPCQ